MTVAADEADRAVDLLLTLQRAGIRLRVEGDRLLANPIDRVTPEQRDQLRSYRPLIVRLFEMGLSAEALESRRQHFAARLTQAGETLVPALVLVEGLPYVPGVCFSCGDSLKTYGFGRCLPCAWAWRLACHVALPELSQAFDGAKAV
jgi:hypothetical protein